MNISIYLEDPLAKQLNLYAKLIHTSRNTIIREAIKEWIKQHQTKQWSSAIMDFKGIPDMPTFESHRNELSPPQTDPFS